MDHDRTDQPGTDAMVTYTVRVSAAAARQLRAAAAREGASPEAVAALWIEEYAAEIAKRRPGEG